MNLQPYPFLDLSDISPCFYLDGFDELAEEIPSTSVKRISTSSIFSHPLLLTSRIQYVRRYLGNYDLMNHFAVQIKINKWDAEKAKGYINNFCAKRERISLFPKEFMACWRIIVNFVAYWIALC